MGGPEGFEFSSDEVRLDAELQRKVIALAARLKQEHDETLTLDQLLAIGEEVGLEREFMRRATKQVVETPAAIKPRTRRRSRRERADVSVAGTLIALMMPLIWGAMTLVLAHYGLNSPASDFLWYAGFPVCMLLGFIAASDDIGFFGGALLIVLAIAARGPDHPSYWLAIFGAILGAVGGDARHNLIARFGVSVDVNKESEKEVGEVPKPALSQKASRADLLQQLFDIQQQLADQQRHAAFLSVDVVGSSQLKLGKDELSIEFTFAKYRSWVESIVTKNGGRIQVAAGDGAMAMFSGNEQAIKAAKEIQIGVAAFNQTGNRLGSELVLRVGVSAGEVAYDESTPIGHLHSPVIDRAAMLQKAASPGDIVVDSQAMPDAVVELGYLAPLNDPVAGGKAFSWLAGKGGKQ